jgi:hypothetical protein
MGSKTLFCLLLIGACSTWAEVPKAYQTGTLRQMISVQCGTAEKDSGVAGEMSSADSGTKKTQKLLCQEYVLETEHVVYHIRPRNEKHAVLLPVGERAEFRLQKDRMLLRVEEGDSKEHEYVVISITPRTDNSSADAFPAHVNHLQ